MSRTKIDDLVNTKLCDSIYSGHKDAEHQFIDLFRSDAIRIAKNWLSCEADAEDAAHEALIIVLNRIRNCHLNKPQQLDRYLFRTVRNVVLANLRRHGVSRTILLENVEEAQFTEPEEVFNNLLQGEIDKSVDNLLLMLSQDRDRELLQSHYREERSKSELCETLNLQADQFDKILYRARKRFRLLVEETHTDLLSVVY